MKLSYQTNSWGEVTGDAGGVTSVKDAYYVTNGSLEVAFKDISDTGYQGVEVFEGNLMSYSKEAFKSLLNKNQLELTGVYTGANFIYQDILHEELLKIEKVSRRAAELGAIHLVIGGGAVRSEGIQEKDYRLLADGLDKAMDIAEKYNLTAHYHPHLGSLGEKPEQIHKIFNLTNINFCPDTAHLEAGGGDPVELMKKYSDRMTYVHLKDLNEQGEFAPLGEGKQDFHSMINILKGIDYKGWIAVELDAYPEPEKGAKISREYLRKQFNF